ncbi:MAG: SMC-Scp complex subunit ScpB [Candidatus Dadabacteria bacterium]|nr:MAG: SMC-Scp complex subunit ScpB [Candidatus Dadabacteria bacterium]
MKEENKIDNTCHSLTQEAQIEALIFAAQQPITAEQLEKTLNIKKENILKIIEILKEKYSSAEHGVELVKVRGGYQFRTKPALSFLIGRLEIQKPRKLSQQALETLAVIAYRQPVTKSEIEKIRGVDASPTLKTLLDKNLITIIGYQKTVGQPALYGTTEKFLEVFGINSLADLPKLREFKEIEETSSASQNNNKETPNIVCS